MKREKNPNQKAFKIVNKKAPVILPKPTEEELATNIGSEENVSFAMSIALQMKNQQREADAARKAEAGIVYKKRNVQYSDADLESFRKKLLAARAEIAEKSSSVKDTIGLNAADDIEPDGGDGSTQSMRLDALSHMEKSSRTINDIDNVYGEPSVGHRCLDRLEAHRTSRSTAAVVLLRRRNRRVPNRVSTGHSIRPSHA